MGALPGIIGALQAVEVIKLIADIGEPLIGRLVLFDALKMEWRKIELRKDPSCALCGPKTIIKTLGDYDRFCGANPAVASVGGVGGRTHRAPE